VWYSFVLTIVPSPYWSCITRSPGPYAITLSSTMCRAHTCVATCQTFVIRERRRVSRFATVPPALGGLGEEPV
jgi:hypothetical protein